jgi:hypothetical protein
MSGIPNIEHRWKELSFRWANRLKERDTTHMITLVRIRARKKFLVTKSCLCHIEKHPFDQRHEELVRLHTRWSVKDTVLLMRQEYLDDQCRNSQHLKLFKIDDDCKPRFLYRISGLSRRKARLISLWCLNKIPGKPRECLRCLATGCSYKHFMICAKAEDIDHKIGSRRWDEVWQKLEEIMRISGLHNTFSMSLED